MPSHHLAYRIKISEASILLMRKFIVQATLVILATIFFCLSNASAAKFYAASCSQTDVQGAVNSAGSGDTVYVPSCPSGATWRSPIQINNKSIIVQGAGIESTIIKGYGFKLTGTNATRITGFRFNLVDGSSALTVEGSANTGPSNWRMDHCKIVGSGNSYYVFGFGTAGNLAKGLIDNCDITYARNVVYGDYEQGTTGAPGGSKRFSEPLGLGTANAIYVESCNFYNTYPGSYSQVIDTRMGGKYVFRFNKMYNTYIEAHHIQGGGDRGTRSWEIYKNEINLESGYLNWLPLSLRGGTGVIWGNTLSGAWSNRRINFDLRRLDENFDISGLCNGYSPWDGNVGPQAGYPCRDQIGRSTDSWLWTLKDPYPPQALDPVYLWNNRDGSSIFRAGACCQSGVSSYIQNNRDYYDEVTSFNGTSGTGSGTLANRPNTCTEGVGYWATDQGSWNKSGSEGQGVLYKCTSNNTWELYYTPYTYPHPLRNQSMTDEPAAPSGLRILK